MLDGSGASGVRRMKGRTLRAGCLSGGFRHRFLSRSMIRLHRHAFVGVDAPIFFFSFFFSRLKVEGFYTFSSGV